MKSILLLFGLLLAILADAQDYVPHVIWDRGGETDSSAYGYNILPLGDQNDDGFADWAVYAQGNGGGWHGTRASYMEFFHGGENLSTQPYFVFREDSTVYHPLWYAEGVGDLNGDGYQDWMASSWLLSSPPTSTEGIFFGGHEPSNIPDLEWTITPGVGLYPLGNFYGNGHGDFNGDGFDDLYKYDFNNDIGWMYYGGNPMDTLPDWTISQPPEGINQTIPYAVGDFNGDGTSDFMCYNPNPPYNLAVFLGGAQPDSVPAYFWSDMMWPIGGVKSLNGDNADEFILSRNVHFGDSILSPTPNYTLDFACQGSGGLYPASAGDFNGDGYRDLLLWTPSCVDNPFGALTLHLGYSWLNAEPVFSIEGDTDPFNLRGIYTAIGLGDVNGDSLDDFAIGAWNETFGPWQGRCVIISGDDSLIADADDSRPELPKELSLEAYPNPFNASATIRIQFPISRSLTTLTVYDVLGQEVRKDILPPFCGDYTYHFYANNLPSGIYLAHVQSGDLQATQKLMLLK